MYTRFLGGAAQFRRCFGAEAAQQKAVGEKSLGKMKKALDNG